MPVEFVLIEPKDLKIDAFVFVLFFFCFFHLLENIQGYFTPSGHLAEIEV